MISWTGLLTQNTFPSRFQRRSTFKGIPEVVVWNATASCNLHCRHCYFDTTKKRDLRELDKKEAADFIEDLARSGVASLIFSGGEPLLREDIFELGGFAESKGLRTALSTNGALITKELAKDIRRAGFSYVGISLDGKEKTNDWFRQKKGAFDLSLSAIRNCQDAGLKVGLRFTLTRFNFMELEYIFDLVEREFIHRFCIYHLVYTGRAALLKEDDISHQTRRGVLELIWRKSLDLYKRNSNIEVLTVDNHADGVWLYLKFKKAYPKRAKMVLDLLKLQGGNSSGQRLCAVDNHGDVYPDQFWRTHSLGNVREKRFSDIWQDEDNGFLKNLRSRKGLVKGRCRRCDFLFICNGNLRARAEAVSGDPWSEDPACYLTDEEIFGNERIYSTSGCA